MWHWNFVGGIISIFIAMRFPTRSFNNLQDALLKSQNANLSRTIQFVITFFFMAFPSFVLARIINKKPFEYIGFNGAISGKQVFIIVGIVLFGFICK